jgi:hypothetical protein
MNLSAAAQPILDAFLLASRRGLIATAMGSSQLAELGKALWEQAFFSARMNNAEVVGGFKELVDRYIEGGYNNDLGKLRVEARKLLHQHGYTPEGGFPVGEGEVPPAEAGSLQDFLSEKRLNLIFKTNAQLARGRTQQTQGLARSEAFPAWELARMHPRRVPRGTVSSGSPGWETRWVKCGGTLTGDRMIALKTDPIWAAIGSRANFPDALDVSHPPFAFNSGYGWKRELSRSECLDLGLKLEAGSTEPPPSPSPTPQAASLPKSLDPSTRAALLAKLKAMPGGFTVDQLKGAIRSQLGKHAATNDAVHLHAALIGSLLYRELVINDGNHDGALKGWETRRGHGHGKQAKSIKDVLDHARDRKDNEVKEHNFGAAPDKTAGRIKHSTGHDVTAKPWIVDTRGVVHAHKTHERELRQDWPRLKEFAHGADIYRIGRRPDRLECWKREPKAWRLAVFTVHQDHLRLKTFKHLKEMPPT